MGEGRFPIEIMDHEALVAYCRLLEELLMRRQPGKVNPTYDCQQQQVKFFNKKKTRGFTKTREHDTVVSSNVATQVEISDKDLKVTKSHSSNSSSPNRQEMRIPKNRLQECSYCLERHIWGRIHCKGFQHRCENCGVFNHLEQACWYKLIEQPKALRNFQKKTGNDDSASEIKSEEEVSDWKLKSDDKDPAVDNNTGDPILANQKELQGFVHNDSCIEPTEPELILNVEESKEKDTKSDKSDADALKSTNLLNSDDNLVSGILGFQEEEKPIKTICYWSNIKGNSYREKETHSNEFVSNVEDHEYSVESKEFDAESNRRFIKWLLKGISEGSPEIFEDRYLVSNIMKNGGIVYEKYMEKKMLLEKEKDVDMPKSQEKEGC